MRGYVALLFASLVAVGVPSLAEGANSVALWGQTGGPGKGGLVGAGGGILTAWTPAETWELEPGGAGGLGESPPRKAEPAPEDSSDDQTSRELSEEKEAEASFIKAQQESPQHTEITPPTDFYKDPLKTFQATTPLPLEEIDLAAFDLPITINEEVATWLEFFLTRGRRFYTGWLARSTRYLPMMEEALADEGVPRDLVYLAMIESGFSSQATSPMQAAGMWQLMRPTGRSYGLRVDPYIDERRDPEKATRAAVRHLRDLYERFGDWYLAIAAYNAGSGKISRAIDRMGSHDFWTLAKGSYLRAETRNYVPKLLAAAIIAKNPDRFGFQDIQYDDVVQYDTVQVSDTTDLQVVARSTGLDLDDLARLNPELRHRRTPPGRYEMKMPVGTAALFDAGYKAQDERLVYRHHRVQAGQTLASIARYYAVPVAELKKMNKIQGTRLRTGSSLLVPQLDAPLAPIDPETRDVEATEVAMRETSAPNSGEVVSAKGSSPVRHRVHAGETWSRIASRYGVDVASLQRWNSQCSKSGLKAGHELVIYRPSSSRSSAPAVAMSARHSDAAVSARHSDAAVSSRRSDVAASARHSDRKATYQVQKGDTVNSIARRYTIEVSDLIRWNHLSARAPLAVGQRITIPRK